MHFVIPLLLLGLAVSVDLASPAPAAPEKVKIPHVLVLGDSLSAGFGLKRTDAYPALLSEKAAAAGQRLRMVNAGVNGDTTAGGLRRLPDLLERRVDVLILELGINDAFQNVPVTQIEANLQKVIDQTRARYPQVRIIIAGMELRRYQASDYVNAFGAIYPDLARRNHAELIPFLLEGVAGDPSLTLPDFLHPNASGQKILAANVWPVLESVLSKH